MPPVKGETQRDKASRLRANAALLNEKASWHRVSTVLKSNPAKCFQVERELEMCNLLDVEPATPVRKESTPMVAIADKPDYASTDDRELLGS